MSDAKDWLWANGFRGVQRCNSFATARRLLERVKASEDQNLAELECRLVAARDAAALAERDVERSSAQVQEIMNLIAAAQAKIDGGAK